MDFKTILKLYIDFTLMFYVVCINKNKALGHLLLISVLNITLTDILSCAKLNPSCVINIYVFLNSLIWLINIKRISSHKKLNNLIIALFIVFNIFSFMFVNILARFDCNVFVAGALSYILIFISESYHRLQNEDLSFFQSNTYLFLSSPILFFVGMSFMFCFNSHELTSTVVYKDIELYTFINPFVNIIYYGLLILYIYKEKKIIYA